MSEILKKLKNSILEFDLDNAEAISQGGYK